MSIEEFSVKRRPVGRPPVGPKLTVRLFPAERLMLEGCAGITDLSLAAFVRAAVVEKCERVEQQYAMQLDAVVTAWEAEQNA